MLREFAEGALDRVYRYRARWSARRLGPWLAAGDRVLDVGAGDCYLDLELNRSIGCMVVPVDMADVNRTMLPLQLYDGRTLPFADGAFDVGLLIFVLHHAEDPAALLCEVKRVCSRRVIAIEDSTASWWDRAKFRRTHRLYDRLLGIAYPRHEWLRERWSALGQRAGLIERWRGPIGRQGGPLSPRHIMYVWEPAPA
jgi:ubiquinone/menaquinone biosynthesis C-methylase UbiE